MVPTFPRNLLGPEDQNRDIANWVDEMKWKKVKKRKAIM
jgi:hypothetical protein